MKLLDYIKKHYGNNQARFARTQGIQPLAAWSQLEFLSPSILNMHYDAFQHRYAIMKDKIVTNRHGHDVVQKFPVGYRNLAELSSIVDRYSYRVLKKDAVDLPDKMYKLINLDMGPKQRKAYDAMVEELMYFFRNEIVTAKNALHKLLHLSRITGGFATQENPLPENPKLKWLKDNVDDYTSSGKVIVWARFVDELKAIQEAFGKRSVLVYGETRKSERSELFDRFRNDDDIQIMVANPKVVGIGLTFLEALTQVYYSNSYELEVRRQSEDRSHRIGQVNKVLYIDLCMRKSIDEKVLKNLLNKRELSDVILKDPACNWLIN